MFCIDQGIPSGVSLEGEENGFNITRHIEVIMKGFALCLTGLALLAAGCAQNRNSDPEIAPSRQASRLTSGSGWSVPPDQHRVTGPAAVRESPQDHAPGIRSPPRHLQSPHSGTKVIGNTASAGHPAATGSSRRRWANDAGTPESGAPRSRKR